MLAADQRLRHRDAFRRTVRSGRRAGGRALVVHLLPGQPGDERPARAGLVVSRAVGGSVARNRVKRRLRHVVRDLMTSLPPSSWLVVRALPPAATMTSAELASELSRCVQRALSAPARPVTRTGAPS